MKRYIAFSFRTSVLFAAALIWLLGAGGSRATTYVFKPGNAATPPELGFSWPPYRDNPSLIPLTSQASAGANSDSGALGAFASAWVGGAAAVADQVVEFDAPERSSVEVAFHMIYTGGTINWGFASFSGTAWYWQLDDGNHHNHDISYAFSYDVIVGKIIDLILLAAPGVPEGDIADMLEALDDLNSFKNLNDTMNSALAATNAYNLDDSFKLTVEPGHHVIRVGLRAAASAFVTGSAFSVLSAQVTNITVNVHTVPGLPADLLISELYVTNGPVAHVPAAIVVERCNIGGLSTWAENYMLYVSPPDTYVFPETNRFDRSEYRADETRTSCIWYTFTNKGPHEILAWADNARVVKEINDEWNGNDNNYRWITVNVMGTRPDRPNQPRWYKSAPPGLGAVHRNQTYTFYTAATDRDNDLLHYQFEACAAGSTNWFTLTNRFDADTNGWSLSSNLDLTPVLGDADLLPGTNINPLTYFTIATNVYRLRAWAGDPDGKSDASIEGVFSVVMNDLPTTPVITGDAIGSTLGGVGITATSTDINGDRIAYRFDWGEATNGPVWTPWYWCPTGQTSVTLSHVYPQAGTYFINVEATDLYATRYTSPVEHSGMASYRVNIYTYRPGTNAVVITTTDAEAGIRLPNVGFYLSSATTNISSTTGNNGYYQTPALPGLYTVNFSNVASYVTPTPSAQMATLATNGHIEFAGAYKHQTSTLYVHCNTAGQGNIYGEGTAMGTNFTFSGTNWSAAAWQGDYEIVYEPAADVDHFSLPVTRRETKTLGDTPIEFCGQYVKRPVASLTLTYPTNNYNPSNSFVLLDEEGVAFDASGSSSPAQPPAGGGCPSPTHLTIDSYWLHFGDGWWCWEATNYAGPGTWHAADGTFDGKNVHVFHQAGTQSVTLTVGDSCGVINRVLVETNVWVKQRPVAQMTIAPAPPIAGETVTFTGSGTDADPGDYITGYNWTSEAGVLSTARTFATNNLTPGLHPIGLTVRANDNVWSKSTNMSLDVLKPKQWPVFKHDECRLSAQTAYDDRPHGQLPYGLAGGNWPHPADGPFEGSPVVANLDGNTNWAAGLEIVFVARTGKLFVTDNTGSNRWMRVIGRSSSTPAIGDLNGDGFPEIVVGCTNGVYAFDRYGKTNYFYRSNSFIFSMPVIADIDPRFPGQEVAITADDGSVHLIYTNGTAGTNHWPFTYTGVPFPSPPDNATNVYFTSAPAVAEIDPNYPGLEVVVGGANGRLYVLDSTGSNICSYYIGTNVPIRTTPVIAELVPGVPGPEVAFGADNGVFYCLNYNHAATNLSLVWHWTDNAPIRSSPAVAILNGEYLQQFPDAHIAFGCDAGDVHMLFGTNGGLLGTFNCPGTNVMVRSTPALADIDTINNVGYWGSLPEVIFGATDGNLYAISFAHGPTLVWSNRLSSPQPIFSSPAVADIDHSPDLEILVGASNNKLYVLRAIPDPNHVPVVDFTASRQTGGRPLTVTFNDQSANNPTSWQWDFGDGGMSWETNATHTYDIPGTNTVTLTVGNANGSASISKTNYIIVLPVPAADFIGTPLFGNVPLVVQFTDQSLYSPSSWSWNFGDGQGSLQMNPSHTYTTAGDYVVTLAAGNTYGTNVTVKTNYITAFPVRPAAAFTQGTTAGWEPLTVQFTDQSVHLPTSWNWNFGDGISSSLQNPGHTYETAGRYLVSLTVSNVAGSDTAVNSSYIEVAPVVLSELPPMLEMHFDEGAGAIAHDSTTNHNDGTIHGTTTWTNGYSGSALYFHGSSGDYVTAPHSASLDITNTFWVEAWIKAQGTANYLGIVDKDSGGATGNGFTLYVNGGLLRLSIYSGAKGACDLWAGLTDLRDNQWHHVAGSWDGSYARGYVDGGKLAEVPWTNAPGSTTQPLCIGKRYTGWGTDMPFLGAIDALVISRAAPLPGALTASRAGTNVVISWTGFGTLEAATNLTGPYVTVTNAISPCTVPPTASQKFYRLSNP